MASHSLCCSGFIVMAAAVLGLGPDAHNAPLPRDWIGEWVNADPETRSTTKVRIAVVDGIPTIQGFGKCHPTDCDWGATRLHLCARSGEEKQIVGLASWDQTFKDHHMVIRLERGVLSIDSYDIYKDNSRRTNRSTGETFRKNCRPPDCGLVCTSAPAHARGIPESVRPVVSQIVP